MSRDKQIEEMARILNKADGFDDDPVWYNDRLHECEALYNAGYRKASDFAEEIFAEIEGILSRQHLKLLFGLPSDVTREVAELKKKYTESEKEE